MEKTLRPEMEPSREKSAASKITALIPAFFAYLITVALCGGVPIVLGTIIKIALGTGDWIISLTTGISTLAPILGIYGGYRAYQYVQRKRR